MASRASLLISFLLHAGVLAAAIGWPSAEEPTPPPKPVVVSLAAPSELSRMSAGSKAATEERSAGETAPAEQADEIVTAAPKQEEPDVAPADNPSERQAALPPPDQPAVRQTAPKREPPPEPAPAETAMRSVPVPVRAERTVRREERPRSEPPRERAETPDGIAGLIREPAPRQEKAERFDPERIAALLNRDPTAGRAPPAAESEPVRPWRQPRSLEEQALAPPDEERQGRRTAYGAPDGRDGRISASEIDAFRAQISRCWTPPAGGLGSERMVVRLRIALHEDGSLARPPQLANESASPFFRPAAESAIRAVMQCQPYRMPPRKYSQWRDMLLTFDPRQMHGG